ncbi:MAG: serine hydrolase domain-containing protein [Acidimicrobiales bacterium]
MDVHGTCSDEFDKVGQAFSRNFEKGLELGAAVAVTVDGAPVVDLWAGDADPRGNPWQEDTIVNVYSSTKTMAATCMLMLADRGELDFDAPVAQYWPEFAQNGKESVLVRHVMSHTSGVSGYDPPVTVEQIYDLDGIAAHLAAQDLWWEPGTKSGYHALTQGNLEGEILYRITGKRMGQWFHDEVAGPTGADFYMGLPASEDHRVAELIPPEVNPTAEPMINGVPITMDMIAGKTLMSLTLTALEPQTREWRAAEIPAAGGIGNARSMARIHSFLACGGEVDGLRLLSEAGVRKALEQQIDNVDEVLMAHLRHGIGFGLALQDWVEPKNDSSMFWGGWGGSIALIDIENRVSIAYVMNRMETEITGDPRAARIVHAVYESLG